MTLNEVVIDGTLQPDGTLVLDSKPGLLPGRVKVVVRQESPAIAGEGWWPYMQRVRAEREAAGYHFMDEAEMNAHVQWLREDEDRIDQIYREMDLDRRRPRNP
jgi:hypothetical protein